jgi:hypothetical protein
VHLGDGCRDRRKAEQDRLNKQQPRKQNEFGIPCERREKPTEKLWRENRDHNRNQAAPDEQKGSSFGDKRARFLFSCPGYTRDEHVCGHERSDEREHEVWNLERCVVDVERLRLHRIHARTIGRA